jgi:hypothetical protein
MADPNAEMHKRSGAVHDADPLVALFYDLLRDHIQPGDLEKLVRSACEHHDKTMVYSNGWLAEYARDMVRRLDTARISSAQATSVLTK